MSLNHASKHLRDLNKKVFAKKHVALGRILARWDDIIGLPLSRNCLPLSMAYRKNGKDNKITAILSIQISSADSLEMAMMEPVILERINQIIGDPRIVKLKQVHSDYTPPEKKNKNQRSPITFDQEELKGALSMVNDPEMRKRLESLASSMQGLPQE